MTKVRRDLVMLIAEMIPRRVAIRQAATQLGVTEGALRSRLKRLAVDAPDGRQDRPSVLDGYEPAVAAILEALVETTRPGRPIQGRLVYEALVRDHG